MARVAVLETRLQPVELNIVRKHQALTDGFQKGQSRRSLCVLLGIPERSGGEKDIRRACQRLDTHQRPPGF